MHISRLKICLFILSLAVIVQADHAYAGEKEMVSGQLASMQLNDLSALFSQAAGGDAQAHLVLGELYYKGKLLPHDLLKAMEHYNKAAQLGSPMAQISLGYLYDLGLGIPSNRAKAISWYFRAAAQNYPAAMFNLGALYESGGDGTESNMDEAIYWYRRAAELGYPDAIAIMKKTVAIHDTWDSDTIANFLEDVLALLPIELAKLLDSDANTLYKEAHPVTNGNYWRKRLPAKDSLIRDWGLQHHLCATNRQQLSMVFGAMVPVIIEVAMAPQSYDPLNEKLQNNVKHFLRDGSYKRYFIAYTGYREQTISDLVERLLALKAQRTDNAYPQLVKLTADLWTTLWHNGRGRVPTSPYNIQRRSFEESFEAQQGDSE